MASSDTYSRIALYHHRQDSGQNNLKRPLLNQKKNVLSSVADHFYLDQKFHT